MDILVLSGSRRKCRRITIGPAGLAIAGAWLLVLFAGVFYGGFQAAESRTTDVVASIRAQTDSMWRQEIENQRKVLQQARTAAEASLNAMAARLTVLHGYVTRLDALGSRLAAMAELDDIEFGIDNLPGIGGPEPAFSAESQAVPDFLAMLDDLEIGLQDRAEKLGAMESLLIDRTLQQQILPDGIPAPGSWMSSLFGFRTDPVTGRREFHTGLDFAGRPGTPITAVAAGIVTWSGERFGYGKMVEISHGNGYVTRYAHNRQNLVAVGERVEKGEIVALMGSSGRATGTHVHFEVVRHGQYKDPRKHITLQ
jgi:murein DD-endopeptidase MepM/ murein hydrolase activator NlpD